MGEVAKRPLQGYARVGETEGLWGALGANSVEGLRGSHPVPTHAFPFMAK